jgi:hypothetical protein
LLPSFIEYRPDGHAHAWHRRYAIPRRYEAREGGRKEGRVEVREGGRKEGEGRDGIEKGRKEGRKH